MKKSVVTEIASSLLAMANCERSGNQEWLEKHRERVLEIVRKTAPSGSGIDTGTALDFDRSTSERLVFTLSFHHMDEHGSYDGWTNHEIVVKASLALDVDVSVKGSNRNGVAGYLADTYHAWLMSPVGDEK